MRTKRRASIAHMEIWRLSAAHSVRQVEMEDRTLGAFGTLH